jgi:hypothetical protein
VERRELVVGFEGDEVERVHTDLDTDERVQRHGGKERVSVVT